MCCKAHTIKALRLPDDHLASLRCLRFAIPREHTAGFVSSVATARRATDLELVTRCPSRDSLPWKRQGLPSSWGTHLSICTWSSTPVGRDAPHQNAALTRSSLNGQRRRQRWFLSRLNRMAFGLAVYASSCRLPRHDARLASGCGLGSTGWC